MYTVFKLLDFCQGPDINTVTVWNRLRMIVWRRYLLSACSLLSCKPVCQVGSEFYSYMPPHTLSGFPWGPVAHVISLYNKRVWVNVGVHPYAYVWDKLCVCVSGYTFNSDLISESQSVFQWDRKLSWNSEFITQATVQRQSLENNLTNLYIYESGIHFAAYITPALSSLILTCYSCNMSS